MRNSITQQQEAEARLSFYTLNELAQHNNSMDAWICMFDNIYDVTSLIEKTKNTKLYSFSVDCAGQDTSSWFDEQTNESSRRIDPYACESVFTY